MKNPVVKSMRGDDERQYMIGEEYEIYEKYGIPTGALQIHFHDFYEIIYIVEGEFSSFVGDAAYNLRKGDFLLINRNEMHNYHYIEGRHENSKRIVLWIRQEMLQRLSKGLVDLTRCFQMMHSRAYHFPVYYEEMLRTLLLRTALAEVPDIQSENGKKLLDEVNLTQFFLYLNELCSRESFFFAPDSTTQNELVNQVTDYIDSHMEEEISVERLADYVHLSKYYFLRRFKELTGMTVHGYVTNKRLIQSCEYLGTDMAVSEISRKCGFADYSSFLRNFRSVYGMSPTEYRKYASKLP